MMKQKMNNYTTIRFTNEIQATLSHCFDCDNVALTAFLKSYDALDDFFGKTYVMIDNANHRIIGYYNIGTGHIEDNMHIRMGGTMYINCLAVDKHYQKQKIESGFYYSDILLGDCIKRIHNLRNEYIGFAFVTLSSTDEGYYLYDRNGFCKLEDDMKIAKNIGEDTCIPMYLPLDYE